MQEELNYFENDCGYLKICGFSTLKQKQVQISTTYDGYLVLKIVPKDGLNIYDVCEHELLLSHLEQSNGFNKLFLEFNDSYMQSNLQL